MQSKRKSPSKCVISMGVKICQTKYTGKVSGVDLLNACIIIMKDTNKMTGMAYKEIFAIVDEGLGAKVFQKKPTISASVSEAVASEDEGDII